MNLTAEKNEIIRWINSLENPSTIEKIIQIKKTESFDFEKEWARSISGEELKARTKEYLKKIDIEKEWKRGIPINEAR